MADPTINPSDLIRAVENKIEKVRTRSLDLSFNELLDMYENDELIIDPEYQRLFRWSEGKQSRFVESLILEMPVPPIFVIEIEEGRYELIDGLQRLSSYFHFRGHHPFRENENNEPKSLTLTECDIVPELNGLTYSQLPKSLEIKLKRNFIRVEILRKESDLRLRYHMFKRLNTGGAQLSDQEMRNCTIRLLSNDFNRFIIGLSQDENFRTCISMVPDERVAERYDQELTLRFFAFKHDMANYEHELGDFLTEFMEKVSEGSLQLDLGQGEECFRKTFRILRNTLGEFTFSGVNLQGHPVSRFTSLHYEPFTMGLQQFLDAINPDDATQMERIKSVMWEIKRDANFRDLTTGGGKNYKTKLEERIRFVTDRLGKVV